MSEIDSKIGELAGRMHLIESAVEHNSDQCIRFAEREREFGELIGNVKAMRKEVADSTLRIQQMEENLNQIIGSRQAQTVNLSYWVSILSAVISVLIGFFFKKQQ